MSVTVDTPDYQAGVVSAQKLLATVAAGTATITTGIPPNCETLVVAAPPGSASGQPICFGTSTFINYPGTQVFPPATTSASSVFAFDVSSVIDAQLRITWPAAPTSPWYVYSDSGVHTVADTSSHKDANGSIFTVPVIPYGQPGSHPPQEISMASSVPAANAQIVAAPGAGKRLRVFGANMSTTGAGLSGYLADSLTGIAFLSCSGVGNNTLYTPPQGLALTANAALEYLLSGGAGGMIVCVQYTTEVI